MKYLLAALLLLSSHAFAQEYDVEETPFNKFIKQPSFEWAAYSYDTLVLPNNSFSNLLIKRMKRREIRTAQYMYNGSKEEQQIKYRTPEENKELSIPGGSISGSFPLFDSLGNPLPLKILPPVEHLPTNILDAYQIFFVKSAKLYSTTSYIAPTFLIITSANDTLGRTEFFTTAINKSPFFYSSPKDKIIYLTQTRRRMDVDSVKQEDKLKETFGRNLIQCLWPSVISNKSKLYLLESGKKVTGKEMMAGGWTGESASVPVYDSIGNISQSKFIYPEVSAKSFKKMEITQTWFYNETKNIVFNKIPEIILFANIKDSSGNTELKPAVKIVF